jgi:hypothetical protein
LGAREVNLASSHRFFLGTDAGEMPSAAAAGETDASGDWDSDPSTARHLGVNRLANSPPRSDPAHAAS